jgi:CDP-diacylglycerol---serine O-phosphatidyltransferase
MDFRLKDCCTLVAVSIAAYAVVAAFEGDIPRASACVLFTWVFDALDGLVARLTGGGTDFGARFDDVVDHVGYSVAPGFIVFAAFRDYSWALGLALCIYLIAIGSVRLARSLTRPLSYPGYWIGLPRSAAAFTICFFLSSRIFHVYQLYIPAALLILVLGAMLLTYLPYRNHKAPMGPWGKLLWLVPVVSVGARPTGYMWDIALFFALVYLTTPLFYVSRAEKQSIDAAVLAWKRG